MKYIIAAMFLVFIGLTSDILMAKQDTAFQPTCAPSVLGRLVGNGTQKFYICNTRRVTNIGTIIYSSDFIGTEDDLPEGAKIVTPKNRARFNDRLYLFGINSSEHQTFREI